jgi:hypothetical protein
MRDYVPCREWHDDVIHDKEDHDSVGETAEQPATTQHRRHGARHHENHGDQDAHQLLKQKAEPRGRRSALERAVCQQATGNRVQDERDGALVDEAGGADIDGARHDPAEDGRDNDCARVAACH